MYLVSLFHVQSETLKVLLHSSFYFKGVNVAVQSAKPFPIELFTSYLNKWGIWVHMEACFVYT
jgi:hypothetical protein